MTKRTAYVLLSGGLDSSVLLCLARREYGYNTVAISINYGQRHQNELESAAKVAKFYNLRHEVYDLPVIGKAGLSDPNFTVPDVSYDEIQGISPTYVPFRNGLLLSTLASIASGQLGEKEGILAYGAHAEDAQNWAYPDCTPEFIGAMANAIFIGSYQRLRLWAPLMNMQKYQIVTVGHDLGVPFHLTTSCYKGGEKHCGTCPTCLSRKQAFIMAKVPDPTEYNA